MSRPPYAVAARELLRETVLDATDALLRERPWAEVTLAEVAKEAGISRQTIYNEFGSRTALAQAYVLREGDRFWYENDPALSSTVRDDLRSTRLSDVIRRNTRITNRMAPYVPGRS